MQSTNPLRTDLVISITLAETFLLLLFIVWSAVADKIGPENNPLDAKLLRQQNEELTRERDQLKKELAEVTRRLDYWRNKFQTAVPGSDQELREWARGEGGKKLLLELGRGKPACEEADNVLVEAKVVGGRESVLILTQPPMLSEKLGAWGAAHLRKGAVLTDPGDIDRLLNGVLSYQRTVEGQLRDCRFDYRFLYRTSDDYMRGREKFERYFYPARVQHVAGAGGR